MVDRHRRCLVCGSCAQTCHGSVARPFKAAMPRFIGAFFVAIRTLEKCPDESGHGRLKAHATENALLDSVLKGDADVGVVAVAFTFALEHQDPDLIFRRVGPALGAEGATVTE